MPPAFRFRSCTSSTIFMAGGRGRRSSCLTYGELIEAALYVVRSGRTIDRATANMLSGFGHEVAISFDEPDEGIWEIRDVPRRFTHSRVLCWTALDRLLELYRKGHLPRANAAEFIAARDRIRQEV